MHVMYFVKKKLYAYKIFVNIYEFNTKKAQKNLIVNNDVSIVAIYDSVIAVSCVIFQLYR